MRADMNWSHHSLHTGTHLSLILDQVDTLTLPLRYSFISHSRKMYNLLTLVDRLDFICKRKRKSISVMKKKKKKSKKNLYHG